MKIKSLIPILGVGIIGISEAIAQEIPTIINESGAPVIDVQNMRFSDLPGLSSSGGFQVPQEVIEQLGFDPSRSWGVGTSIADILQLGDMPEIAQNSLWGLNSFLGGEHPQNISLSLFSNQSLFDFVNSVPGLKNNKLNQVPALKELIGNYQLLGANDGNKKLSQFINKPGLKNVKLGSINLGEYAVIGIPNLANTPLSNFKGWEGLSISSIPGLSNIPFSQLFNIPNIGGMIAMHDFTYGYKEHRFTPTKRSITGSEEVGFNYQCVQDRGCAYLELIGEAGLHGAQWIKGGKGLGGQMVPGGHGVLGQMFEGFEPTGRHPFGDLFKVVLIDTIESQGMGTFGLYFRVCIKSGFADFGCTPYAIGPIPWFISREKNLIFLGY
ncbi:MAG: hypothetical protein SWX82_30485 [Cyanobacteriota bacterium]|nr:hypothetical protein [Cyanobacteriota bacterium]